MVKFFKVAGHMFSIEMDDGSLLWDKMTEITGLSRSAGRGATLQPLLLS